MFWMKVNFFPELCSLRFFFQFRTCDVTEVIGRGLVRHAKHRTPEVGVCILHPACCQFYTKTLGWKCQHCLSCASSQCSVHNLNILRVTINWEIWHCHYLQSQCKPCSQKKTGPRSRYCMENKIITFTVNRLQINFNKNGLHLKWKVLLYYI